MTAVACHPPADKLADFGLGRLDDEESRRFEEHLAACPSCQQLLEHQPGDRFVQLIQEACKPTRADPPAACQTLRSDDRMRPATEPRAAANPPQSSLHGRLARVLGVPVPATPSPRDTAAAPADRPPIPAELAGHARYEILERLGAGGMGTVFKARHKVMHRVVALKIVHPALTRKPAAVERFRHEVQTAAQLVHPNIVTAYDAESAGNLHFLVMEYVDGDDLGFVLARKGPLPVAEACEYARQAAVGLQHAHGCGLVHRDIKPQNLILTRDGQVKILDFGLARFVSESRAEPGESAGLRMGTPDYMAPEQAADPQQADIRADIYGLGCSLYCLLADQVPFPGGSVQDKLAAHRERTPAPLTARRPDLPAGLVRVVERMMAKDPANRYPTPAEVAEALKPFCQPQPVIRKKSHPAVVPLLRRNARRLMIAALLLALLGLGGALFAPAIYLIATNQGVLVIETNDLDVNVIVKRGGEQVTIVDAQTGREVTLKAGRYELELAGGAKGLTLSTNEFRLARGRKQIVVVRFENWVYQLANDAQTEMVSVDVLVVDLDRHPIAKADVLAYCTPWDFVQRGKTGEDGRWTLRGPKGNWNFYAGSEHRASEGVVAALRHVRIEGSMMVTVRPDRQMTFAFESPMPSDILVRLTPTDLPSPVECIYCGTVKPNARTTWAVSSGMTGIATLVQQPEVGRRGRLQFVPFETGQSSRPPNNAGPVGRVRFSLDSRLAAHSWWNFFFDPLDHEAGVQWPVAPRVAPGPSTYEIDVTPGQYRVWTDFHQANSDGSLQLGASFAPGVVTVKAGQDLNLPFSTQLRVKSVEVLAWDTMVHLWFDLQDAIENYVDWLPGTATLRIRQDAAVAYDGPVTGSSCRYIGLEEPLSKMRTGNLIEVEYAYDSPVIGKMTYRGTLPQDKSFAGDLPVIAESDHFRFRSRDSRAYGKETLRELERAYSWLAENYAGAVRPDKSSHFEVGLWSGVGGAVAAGDTFGLDVYSAGKLVPNTCPEHGMGMLFNVFGHCYKAKFPYYHAREMGSGASQASLIAAYCLRANQGDRVFRQCRQLWSTRFFEHLLGRVSDSGFPDFDRHTFILFYLDARYGLHINRDFFRAVYADEGNCAQLLATMDFLANDHERTAAVYSFLVGENLAWLYRWARLPVAEASIDEAVIRFQELKATPPPPWPATR